MHNGTMHGLPFGQPPDAYEGDFGDFGLLAADELAAAHCPHCGGEQLGYYGDAPDHELIGRYCPTCGTDGLGYGDDMEQYGQYPEEEMGYYGSFPDEGPMMGYVGQSPDDMDMGYYGSFPDEGPMRGHYVQPPEHVGYYGQADDEISYYGQPEDDVGYYGQADDEIGYYGPYRDPVFGMAADDVDDGVGAYVRQEPPPFNPRGDFGTQLAGYVRERTVNPTCTIRRTTAPTPLPPAPDIFKPYF